MPEYRYRCPCGQDMVIEKCMDDSSTEETCLRCGAVMRRVFEMPRLNLNAWNPDPREMNAEKEATAAGMYE